MAGLLAPGDPAPAFTPDRDGCGTLRLKDFRGTKLVLFFCPQTGTSDCTCKALNFHRLWSDFAEIETARRVG